MADSLRELTFQGLLELHDRFERMGFRLQLSDQLRWERIKRENMALMNATPQESSKTDADGRI